MSINLNKIIEKLIVALNIENFLDKEMLKDYLASMSKIYTQINYGSNQPNQPNQPNSQSQISQITQVSQVNEVSQLNQVNQINQISQVYQVNLINLVNQLNLVHQISQENQIKSLMTEDSDETKEISSDIAKHNTQNVSVDLQLQKKQGKFKFQNLRRILFRNTNEIQ